MTKKFVWAMLVTAILVGGIVFVNIGNSGAVIPSERPEATRTPSNGSSNGSVLSSGAASLGSTGAGNGNNGVGDNNGGGVGNGNGNNGATGQPGGNGNDNGNSEARANGNGNGNSNANGNNGKGNGGNGNNGNANGDGNENGSNGGSGSNNGNNGNANNGNSNNGNCNNGGVNNGNSNGNVNNGNDGSKNNGSGNGNNGAGGNSGNGNNGNGGNGNNGNGNSGNNGNGNNGNNGNGDGNNGNGNGNGTGSNPNKRYKVSGYILDSNGNGIPGAMIIFCVPNLVPAQISDSSGYYEMNAPAGQYQVNVWPPFDSHYIFFEEKYLTVNSDMQKNITLATGFRISGTITDASGAPVSGAVVWLTTPGQSAYYFCGWYSKSDGKYFVTAPPGTYTLNLKPKTGLSFPSYSEGGITLTSNTAKNIVIGGSVSP